MKQFLSALMQDKNGQYSLRELAVCILLIALLVAWIAQQFYNKAIPESMFFTLASLVAAGCFGYSMERRQVTENN
ncbi:hypothetical protein HGH93_12050 [Chitinophaga polysaccharea]|uniref:Uncharacterized protein n=1 Tax=Chitinophaga eiseniae TaxID=634771 RepID=A0A847SRQ8_9BACT|nr:MULTISPECIES: hypothetical protein [Chitinophaga]NLR58839.1 hypothetical protein [Chitinophaga polysaccharea]NLR82265.1 hypothetical protein [Chitinophaga eiseniae]